jgi:hypothetical protein
MSNLTKTPRAAALNSASRRRRQSRLATAQSNHT